MVVYGLPWTQAIKIIHFELTWDIKDSEDTEGATLDLSEFNVNVMTGNNGAHQRSPYDPGIQK